jgi:hypothetical protein
MVFDFDSLRMFQKENRNSLLLAESESIINSYGNFGNGSCRVDAGVSNCFSKLRYLLEVRHR